MSGATIKYSLNVGGDLLISSLIDKFIIDGAPPPILRIFQISGAKLSTPAFHLPVTGVASIIRATPLCYQ